MSIGGRIRILRTEEKLSQSFFAERCKVSLRALKAYELDEREPPVSFITRVFDEFAVEPTWLLLGSGGRTASSRNENIVDAFAIVREFFKAQNVHPTIEDEAHLVLLLAEYFDEGGAKDSSLVIKILETKK